MRIIGVTFNHLYANVCKALLSSPQVTTRGLITKELTNVELRLINPLFNVLTLTHRKLSIKYLCAELLWYFSRDFSIKHISQYATLWREIANEDDEVNSNYGGLIFNNQLAFVIEQFKSDLFTRKAVINLNQDWHKYDNLQDFPCTISLTFLVRENKLSMTTHMRSNDVVYGLSYDLTFFTLVQQILLLVLRQFYPTLELGSYYHYVVSMHVYTQHFEMLESILKVATYTRPYTMKVSSDFIDDLCMGTRKSLLMNFLLTQSHYPMQSFTLPTLKEYWQLTSTKRRKK